MNGFDEMVLTDVFGHAQKMANDSTQSDAIRAAAKQLVGTMLEEIEDLSQRAQRVDCSAASATTAQNFPQYSS